LTDWSLIEGNNDETTKYGGFSQLWFLKLPANHYTNRRLIMKSIRTLPITLLLLTLSITAQAFDLKPQQGYTVPFGGQTAVFYYPVQENQLLLVTTILDTRSSQPKERRVLHFIPGERRIVPVTGQGWPVMTVTGNLDSLIIEMHYDRQPAVPLDQRYSSVY
jgi:hypothetical protein